MRLLELFAHPPGEVVQFVDSAGEPMGTLLFHTEQRATEYAELMAYAEANLEELRRLAGTPRAQCATTAEVIARAKSHAPD